MSKQTELSRFTASGKTFFFNKGKAKNGTDYLAVNAIYGQGNRERTVLFPPHYMEYVKHITEAVESLTGFKKIGGAMWTEDGPELTCECDAPTVALRNPADKTIWCIACSECGTTLKESFDGASVAVKEASDAGSII